MNQAEYFHAEGDADQRTVRFAGQLNIPFLKAPPWIHAEAGRAGEEAGLHLAMPVEAGTSAVTIDETVELPSAEAWSTDKPILYWARLRCTGDERTVAEAETVFGFRQFRVREGRFRAGKNWFAVRAAALGPRCVSVERELAALKGLGFNTMVVERQRAKRLLPVSDRIGLPVLVTTEVEPLPGDAVRVDQANLQRYPSFLGSVGEDGSVFMNTGWDQLAGLGEKSPQEVAAAYSAPRSDGRPTLVRLVVPQEVDTGAEDIRAGFEALAMLRMATGIAGYCLSNQGGRPWADASGEGTQKLSLPASYLPRIHGLTVLLLRTRGKQFAPGESVEITTLLLNAGGYTGDATLVITDAGPDKTRRTHRQPVHITKSSRSFAPVTLTAPTIPGEWEVEAGLVAHEGACLGSAVPWVGKVLGE